MFYSHEILNSREYGVATIWLVSTVGKTSSRKVSKKAIQEVDIVKACNKILDPGAPIALRLQGQLLHGVAGVHKRQCDFILSDAQKVYTTINLFAKSSSRHLDAESAQGRRENLLIQDDPSFLPTIELPRFDLVEFEAFMESQASRKTSSQMSPHGSSVLASSQGSGGVDMPFQLDFHHSDSSGLRLPSHGLQGLSSAQKPHDTAEMPDLAAGEEVVEDWGIEVDAEGNLSFGVAPSAPVTGEADVPPAHGATHMPEQAPAEDGNLQPLQDDGLVIMDEEPLPEAEPFPTRQSHQSSDAFQDDRAPAQRKATRTGRKRRFGPDQELQVKRGDIRRWQENYSQNCCSEDTSSRKQNHQKQARENAMQLTFGFGLGGIGIPMGFPGIFSPLAMTFSGDSLFTTITGIEVPKTPQKRRGRPRKASVAFPDGNEAGRRVKPRLEIEGDSHGSGLGGHDELAEAHPGSDNAFNEAGRDAQDPMSEHLSSAMKQPFNRGSSVVPGSTARGSVPRVQSLQSSPLARREDAQYITHYSDDGPINFGEDSFGATDSQNGTFHAVAFPVHEGHKMAGQTQQEAQALRSALDTQGRNFLSFIQEMITAQNEFQPEARESNSRHWVSFDDVFLPSKTDHATAAQALYHALCLTTQGQMKVDQRVRKDYSLDEEIWMSADITGLCNT